MSNDRTLIVEYPSHWEKLSLHQSSKIAAGALLSNEFETLVDISEHGRPLPLAAKSWSASNDFKVFTFKIDTNRSFSDGTALRAEHFKSAWERGFQELGATSLHHIPEALHKMLGFEHFLDTGTLPGVRSLDHETLEVCFSEPFRMALDRLANIPFAVFRDVDDRRMGTGAYIIHEMEHGQLRLLRNRFHQLASHAFSEITVRVANPASTDAGKIAADTDVFMLAGKSGIASATAHDENLQCISEFEDSHVLLETNGLEGRVLACQRLRQALQFMIHQALEKNGHDTGAWLHQVAGLRFDPQPYLPEQTGRLRASEVNALIAQGEAHVDDLIAASRREPLLMLYAKAFRLGGLVHRFLVEKGLELAPTSGGVEYQELYRRYVRLHEADIALFTTSVVAGDPDGLYHMLGENGGIAIKASLRPKTAQLLEDGKLICQLDALTEHYQRVTKSVLDEVPFVHIGYIRDATIVNKARVGVPHDRIVSRLKRNFSDFTPKS